MHILLLTAIVLSGLVWGVVNLQREVRRREWSKKNTTPLFSISEPRELVATLALCLLKCGGELTIQQKELLLAIYRDELRYNEKEANEAFSYASYALGTDPNYSNKAREIAAPALSKFNQEQRNSTLNLLQDLVSNPTERQENFLADIKQQFLQN